MPINCAGCDAACCKVVGKIMKELDRGDNVCKFLTNDNKCTIYDDRPFICNTDKIYEKYFSSKYTKVQWAELNRKACESLHGTTYKSGI